jgi:hypothetical protein
MKTFKRILGVLLIFIFGFVAGAMVAGAGALQRFRQVIIGGPEAVVDMVVWRLDHELKLDPEQKRKLQGIVDEARIRLRQSREKVRPEVEQTLRDAEERTRAILYPNQVSKFDDMVAHSREKWKASGHANAPAATPAAPTPETPAPKPEFSPSGTEPSPAPSAPTGAEPGK